MQKAYYEIFGIGCAHHLNPVPGVRVMELDPLSSAAQAGLRAGDVIVEINRQSVNSGDEAIEISRAVTDNYVLLRVWRSHYVVIEAQTKTNKKSNGVNPQE